MSGHFKVVKVEVCEECGHETRTYRRYLHGEMVKFMLALGQHGGSATNRELFPDQTKASTDGSYLPYWGLTRRLKLGHYALTDKGWAFLAGGQVPKWIELRDLVVVNVAKRMVSFEDFR